MWDKNIYRDKDNQGKYQFIIAEKGDRERVIKKKKVIGRDREKERLKECIQMLINLVEPIKVTKNMKQTKLKAFPHQISSL